MIGEIPSVHTFNKIIQLHWVFFFSVLVCVCQRIHTQWYWDRGVYSIHTVYSTPRIPCVYYVIQKYWDRLCWDSLSYKKTWKYSESQFSHRVKWPGALQSWMGFGCFISSYYYSASDPFYAHGFNTLDTRIQTFTAKTGCFLRTLQNKLIYTNIFDHV